MQLSSYQPSQAHDDIKDLINSNDIQYVKKVVGCCKRNYLKFEGDDHLYTYNATKNISNILLKKVFTYLYIDMKKSLDKQINKDKNTYRLSVKENLNKLKNNLIPNLKIDLTTININSLASDLSNVSNDVKLFMKLLTAERHYALNDRTINLLLKGNIDMTASTSMKDGTNDAKGSDEDIVDLLDIETEVELFVIEKIRQGLVEHFPFINNTIFIFDKYGIFKTVNKDNYKHNCLYLALEEGGLSHIKLQQLVLALRNRTIHKCDLENVCDALHIQIVIKSIRNDGDTRVEHYGTNYEESII